jgi:peptidyl-prolyl cis-trans isomerase SurA
MLFNKNIKSLLFIALAMITSSFCYSNLLAQQIKEGESLDKIAAIVGNEIIMQSDIKGKLVLLAQQNPSIDINNPETRNKVLNSLIDEKLVIMKAIEDSVVVGEDEITQRWDYFLKQLIQYYGSEKRIEDVYSMSLSRLQFEYRDLIKKQLLIEKIQQQKFSSVKSSGREVEQFFKEFKDSLPNIPEQTELCHIVKYVKSDNEAKERTFALAKKVRDSIIAGGNFADFAKRYSNDPGTANVGGDLGWFAKGKLLAEFERAAFDLTPGQISMPIETPFGYHVIQTIDKKRDSVLTKHILFKIIQSTDDNDRVIKQLTEIKAKVDKGESFTTLAKTESDENESKGFGGSIGTFDAGNMPVNIKDFVTKMAVGEVSQPLPYTLDPTKPAYRLLYKKAVIAEHKPSMENDYKLIEQKASMYKQMKQYQDWIETLRKSMYWEIKN